MNKISVITVCYNDAENLRKTLASMASQTARRDIEHIVIDGGSKDETKILLEGNKEIDKWISEADKGLYDAMNKGIAMASGEYLWFMNAGDVFYSDNTVESLIEELNQSDIVYGAAVLVDDQGRDQGLYHKTLPEKLTWKNFIKGMVVCHQALIVKRSMVEVYSLDFKIASDIDWAIRNCKKTNKIHNSNIILCKFQTGGLSKKRQRLALQERFKILKNHFGLIDTILAHISIVLQYFLVKLGFKKTRN